MNFTPLASTSLALIMSICILLILLCMNSSKTQKPWPTTSPASGVFLHLKKHGPKQEFWSYRFNGTQVLCPHLLSSKGSPPTPAPSGSRKGVYYPSRQQQCQEMTRGWALAKVMEGLEVCVCWLIISSALFHTQKGLLWHRIRLKSLDTSEIMTFISFSCSILEQLGQWVSGSVMGFRLICL